MSKGLEALKDLVDTMPLALIETNSMRYVEVIEKELKALEIIKKYAELLRLKGSIPREEYLLLEVILHEKED